jgi:hypothetical protein
MHKWVFLFSSLLVTSGCVTTQVKGYTDSKYRGAIIGSVAVLANSQDVGLSEAIESGLESSLKQYGVRTVRSQTILPPTRAYTEQEIRDSLTGNGIAALLIVNIAGSETSSETIGYNTFGTATATTYGSAYATGYNSAYYSGSTGITGSSQTYAVKRFDRNTIASSTLYDVQTGDVMWTSNSETKAGGALYMSDDTTGGDLAESIVKSLAESGHFGVKK